MERKVLVLSRKIGERIVIGDGIEVTVSRISASRVTLGVKAPAECRIMRAELPEKKFLGMDGRGLVTKWAASTLDDVRR